MSRRESILAALPAKLAIARYGGTGSSWDGKDYPVAGILRVQVTWPVSVAKTMPVSKPAGKIILFDNDVGVKNETDLVARCRDYAALCDRARANGWQPGVVSIGPWTEGARLCKSTTLDRANEIIGAELVPSADWLAWEFYGTGASTRLRAWANTFEAMKWDCAVAALIHPGSYTNAAFSPWLSTLDAARERVDLAIRWLMDWDAWPAPLTYPRWLFDVAMMGAFGLTKGSDL
ncbi:MAG: hypothetical protein IMZ55_04915 [Acidobacteria bacterium]|nr:hypothetical protein [Acidobacteriota bacterium]